MYSYLVLSYFTSNEYKSKVFLDTNILLWSLHINRQAFNELISFLDSLARKDKLVIPNWVIFEFDQYVRQKKTIANPYSSISKQLQKSLSNFEKVINLRTDQELASHLNYNSTEELKSAYKEAKTTIDELVKIGNHKKKGEIESRIEELNRIIRERGSNSKLNEILKQAQDTCEFRYTNGIPPGFADAEKPTNKHGDLILWLEIINHSKINENNIALFLTNDNKSDWVAKYPTDDTDYVDAHPYLKHEYNSIINRGEFYIVNMELLINSFFSVESYRQTNWNYSEFKHLSAALGVKLGNTPTKDIIDWIIKNEKANKDLSQICRWDFDPSKADHEGMEKYIKQNYPHKINMKEVSFGEVFCELFL